MQGQYTSRRAPFYASEDISFEFQLKRGSEVIDLSDVNIGIEIYTSQLSPRRFAMSFAKKDDYITTPGVVMDRYTSLAVLNLAPSFLKSLPSGVLTVVLRYHLPNGKVVTNKIPTERFINDLPIEEQSEYLIVSDDEVVLSEENNNTDSVDVISDMPWSVR